MGSVYPRKNKLWIKYRGADGKRRQQSTGFDVGQERKARRLLHLIESRIAAGEEVGADLSGHVTLNAYFSHWMERRAKQVQDWKKDKRRLELHVLPQLGAIRIDAIRPRHVNDVVQELRGKRAPHTIRSVYGVMRALFRDASIDELIFENPCVLSKYQLGEDVPVDPVALSQSRYSRDELMTLIYDERIATDARVFYALCGLAGLRLSEVAGLRWSDVELGMMPLGRITVSRSYGKQRTKTQRIRPVPIHPALAAILSAWKLGGWCELMGRIPGGDDLVVPRPASLRVEAGAMHSRSTVDKRIHRDLERVEIDRPLQVIHALRSTFISLALEDGADDYLLRQVTHTSKSQQAFDGYAKIRWPARCAEVAKLIVNRPSQERVVISLAAHAGPVQRSGDEVSDQRRSPSRPTLALQPGGQGAETHRGEPGTEAPAREAADARAPLASGRPQEVAGQTPADESSRTSFATLSATPEKKSESFRVSKEWRRGESNPALHDSLSSHHVYSHSQPDNITTDHHRYREEQPALSSPSVQSRCSGVADAIIDLKSALIRWDVHGDRQSLTAALHRCLEKLSATDND